MDFLLRKYKVLTHFEKLHGIDSVEAIMGSDAFCWVNIKMYRMLHP